MSNGDGTVLTGTAVQEVARLAQEAAQVQRLDYEGYEYTTVPLVRVDVDPKLPQPLMFTRLTGLLDFLNAEAWSDDERVLVHVETPIEVSVVGGRIGIDRHLRRRYAKAVCATGLPLGFDFNRYVTLETMAIALQTCFVPTSEVEDLRRFCASIRETEEMTTADDGVSQSVNARSGIASVQEVAVKPGWTLRPYRTFPEVEQPPSVYILRLQRGAGKLPQAGLFETGSALWQVTAVGAIADWFVNSGLPDRVQVLG